MKIVSRAIRILIGNLLNGNRDSIQEFWKNSEKEEVSLFWSNIGVWVPMKIS